MKAKIWVLCTVLADENAPAMPAVFVDEAEAWAKYDEVIRAEWDSMMDPDTDGLYPGDPDEAQERIRHAHGAEWSRWELTRHDIEIFLERKLRGALIHVCLFALPLQL
jgi:hypothetical protein